MSLRDDLSAIEQRGADVIRGRKVRATVARAVDEALGIVVVVASGLLLLRLLFNVETTIGIACGWSISLAALWIPIRAAGASFGSVRRNKALLEVDRQLELRDRMTTASEFLESDTQTPFMQAAIADATRHVHRGRTETLSAVAETWAMSQRGWALLVVGLVLLLVFTSFETTGSPELGVPTPSPITVAEGGDTVPEPTEPESRPPSDPEETTPVERTKPTGASSARPGQEQGPPTEEVKRSRGKTGSGRSAEAVSATGKGDARGTPSTQGQATKPAQDKAKKKKKKPSKKKPDTQDPDRKRKQEDESGATSGRGVSSGSNKSPAASEWASKDQVTSDEEEDLEDDEEVDDEFDESEARGGLQPHLRDRRPPVNRDLGIGFGNAKNPDANGRGGASEMKKSRGVASLVLGVPLPDHVKGRPNPGKTKVTQERVEPQPESTASADAAHRKPRATTTGHLTRPELLPWMRDLVRAYYEALRSKRNRP